VSIHLAAIGDLHLKESVPDGLADELADVHRVADGLVVAGDITDGGRLPEVELAASLLESVRVPIVAVLGNHDRRCLRRTAFRRILERAGVTLLDGEAATLRLGSRGETVGFAGVGGYGGGFWPDEGPPWPQYRISQAMSIRARREALRLDAALGSVAIDAPKHRVVVLHYSPTATTLGDEPLAKYWMLGNASLARVIDRHQVDLVLHGHAHLGNSHGRTPGGTPVCNVAAPVNGGLTIHALKPVNASSSSLADWRREAAPGKLVDLAERRR
jgi:Icc-related predicted phosphoesterase